MLFFKWTDGGSSDDFRDWHDHRGSSPCTRFSGVYSPALPEVWQPENENLGRSITRFLIPDTLFPHHPILSMLGMRAQNRQRDRKGR